MNKKHPLLYQELKNYYRLDPWRGIDQRFRKSNEKNDQVEALPEIGVA